MRTSPRNYRRRRADDCKYATVEAKLSSSLYSGPNPRIYRANGVNEIDGKDATVEAKPSSSLNSSACIFLMDEDGEEDEVLPITITYKEDSSGSSHELYSFNKEQYPAYPAAISNVFPQAGGSSSGLIKPPQKSLEDEDEFLSAQAADGYRFHGVTFNGVRMRRTSRSFDEGRMVETYSIGGDDEKPLPLEESMKRNVFEDEEDDDLEELLLHKKRLLERNVYVPSATILDTNPMSLLQQAEIAKKESHAKVFSYLTAPLMSIAAREGSLSVPVDKFVFLQKFNDSTFVIHDFLQKKVSLIEEIEVQIKEFDEKHASAILERRTADENGEMVELGAAVEAAMAVLNKQGNSHSAFAAATSAALAASASIRQQTSQPVQLEEFGREENLRDAARQKRRARFENKRRASAMGIDGFSLKIQGESSTDESDSETSAYKETRDGLLECTDKVFSDASDVYSRLLRVRTRFKRWKRNNSSTYQDAYMSLNVPSIFSPYLRLDFLKWDPLHQDVDFVDMKWHGLLFDHHGKPEDEDDYEPDDTDANLVSELVEKVAIPILHHRIVHCWDILSTRETRNAVTATRLVKSYVSASSEALAELFSAIRARLVEGITAISVPTWDPLVLKAVSNAPQAVAYRFGTSIRLMRNICMWKGILALPVLEKLALSDLLFAKVLPHVRDIASESSIHDAVTRTERIVASLSGVWTGPSVKKTHSRRPLQPLVDCTLTLGRILEKRLEDAETTGLARRLKRILVEIHEHEHAKEMVRTFDLKETL